MNDYHQTEGISRSELFRLAKSPEHFKYCMDNPPEQTRDMLLGIAFHKLVLEPQDFDNEFAVYPVCDRRTKISSLDTGGYMLSDGLIYAHRGEAVVREDITEGLLETIALVKQMSAQTNYNNVSNSYDNRSSVGSVSNPSYGGDTYNSYKIDVHLDNVSFPSEATKLSAHDRLNQLSRDMTQLIGQLPR